MAGSFGKYLPAQGEPVRQHEPAYFPNLSALCIPAILPTFDRRRQTIGMTNLELTSAMLDQRRAALSRWDNEGGAGPCGQQSAPPYNPEGCDTPDLSNADLVQLRIRVIALENVMIALLAQVPEAGLQTVRDMAARILPRAGHTQHPLTIHAATQMLQMVERAQHFATDK